MSGWGPRKRFWTQASVRPAEGGFAVELDGRPLRTPDRRAVVVPTEALAQGIAAEWDALEGEVRPERLPLTRAVNSAIDQIPTARQAVVEALAAYGDSDLLSYRAEEPEALRMRQAAAWDPWLDWARRELDAPLVAVAGVMPQPQPPASLAALRAVVDRHDAFGLAGLGEIVALSGSLVLGLAVARGAIAPDAAWTLSRLDATWQAEQWGADAEAASAAAQIAADFRQAAHFLTLLGEADKRVGKR
jgi:chaperone required for assembly of F1-ATPase